MRATFIQTAAGGAGPMMVPDNETMKFPRLCAHRGFSAVAPENSMAAYGAAIALGAEEIEFDVRQTSDRVLVSCHDGTLERISDGTGNVSDYTYEELLKLDFGVKFGPAFRNLRILSFEEILRQFSGTVIMNIHVKFWEKPDFDPMYEEIAGLIRKYGAEKHCYMMSSSADSLLEFRKVAPEISVCLGVGQHLSDLVETAVRYGFPRVQFFVPRGHEIEEIYTKEKLDLAHRHNIVCNYCQADDETYALKLLADGVDVVMTNEFQRIASAVDEACPGIRYRSAKR